MSYKKLNIEIGLISNSNKYKIDIYTCLNSEDDKVEYVLRRRKDQKLICKMDKNLNIVGNIENFILVNHLQEAYTRLKEYKERTDWVDEYFSI